MPSPTSSSWASGCAGWASPRVPARSRCDFSGTERAWRAFVQPHLVALLRLAHPAGSGPTGAAGLAATLGLTAREADILGHVAQDRADKRIIHHCRTSPRTAQNHLASIYAKPRVENRTAASLRAVAGAEAQVRQGTGPKTWP